ncbi:MAG: MFS transporter, partial [Acidimicrobiales bacterium]
MAPLAASVLGFVALGLGVSAIGPALSNLREHVGVGVVTVALVLPATSAGNLLGATTAGLLVDRRWGHAVFGSALAATAGGLWVVATTRSLTAMIAAAFVIGLASGMIDVAGNTLVAWRPGLDQTRSLNGLHLGFGIGALAGPAIVGVSIAWRGDITLVAVAVAIVGAAAILGLVRRERPAPPPHHAAIGEARGPVAVVAVFFALYVGVEIGFASWTHTYAQEIDLGGPAAATGLTASFWAAFTAGRLAVTAAPRSRPLVVLTASLGLSLAGITALAVAFGSPVLVWPATVVFGLGIGPQYATMLAFADRRIALSGRATSWIVAGSALGGIVVPYAFGLVLDRAGATALPFAALL